MKMELVEVSITGVPVIPISGVMSLQPTSPLETLRDLQQGRMGGQEIRVPKQLTAVDVEGVDLVVLGGDVQNVMRTSVDDYAGHIERLRVNLSLHGKQRLAAKS